MRRRSLIESSPSESPSDESDYIRSDADSGVESDTDLSDVNAITDKNDEDKAWLSPNEDHSREHYLQQLEIFDEREFTKEDYKDSSTRLLDRMEDQWNQ
jgi:hypothetical protein